MAFQLHALSDGDTKCTIRRVLFIAGKNQLFTDGIKPVGYLTELFYA